MICLGESMLTVPDHVLVTLVHRDGLQNEVLCHLLRIDEVLCHLLRLTGQ